MAKSIKRRLSAIAFSSKKIVSLVQQRSHYLIPILYEDALICKK
ncbi:hypothetical protein [uncultured Nostoc sp.]